MFKVTVLCEDTQLKPMLLGLRGFTVGKPEVDPVSTEEEAAESAVDLARGVPTTKAPRKYNPKPVGQTLPGRVFTHLVKQGKLTGINGPDVVKAIAAVKGNPGSRSFVFKYLQDNNLLLGGGPYSLNMAEFAKRAGGTVQQTGPEGGGRPPNASHDGLTFAQRVANSNSRLPLASVLPGKVMQRLVDKGVTNVSMNDIGEAAKAVGSSVTSAYYISLFLAKRGLLTAMGDNQFTLHADAFKRQIAATGG